ncbi:unnamed protein product [Prorocentrum cordatum]|uniref:Uncharacterized protein n=1 Tax=Prorocentrum cordatum TaxID=2364126 RepID=A0ABN9X3E9_9DINO|nr:unnamed protein product [Polarella glacialis]
MPLHTALVFALFRSPGRPPPQRPRAPRNAGQSARRERSWRSGIGICWLPQQVVQQGKRLSDAAVAALPAFACDGPPEPEWHANGTIVGLLIDVGGTSGYYMFLILTMFFGLEANKDELLACHIGTGRMQLATWPQACLCEYTKAHLLIFPTLALSVVLVFMGRDLLQKRLYYGLLRSGGVVDFSQNKAFKDSLVLLFIVNYLHVVSHLALMYWVARPAYSHTEDDPSVAAPGFLRHQADAMRRNLALESGNLHALGFLWGTVMIPGTLVVVFVFLGYEIEKSLVPLSLYVHGLNDSQAPEAALQGLSVFRDASAKAVIEDPSGPVAAASGSDLDTQYRAVVDAASQVPPSQDPGTSRAPPSGCARPCGPWPCCCGPTRRTATRGPSGGCGWPWPAPPSA